MAKRMVREEGRRRCTWCEKVVICDDEPEEETLLDEGDMRKDSRLPRVGISQG